MRRAPPGPRGRTPRHPHRKNGNAAAPHPRRPVSCPRRALRVMNDTEHFQAVPRWYRNRIRPAPGTGRALCGKQGLFRALARPSRARPASGVAPCVMKDTELASLSPQCSLGVASGVARRQPRQARKLRNSRNWPASCATRATTVNVRTREAAEAPAACLRHREKLMLEPFTPPSGVADNLDSRRRARDGRETGDS